MCDQKLVTSFAELIERRILEIGDGYRAKNSELGGSGPIFLRAGLLASSGWHWEGAGRFRADLSTSLAPKMGRAGDVVITTKGNSVGRSGCVPIGAPPFVYSPHLSYWRTTNPSKLSPVYLRYWAISSEFAGQLHALAHGTDMAPYLSLADQRRLRISLPSIRQQAAIGAVLGALDDKIAANERIAMTTRQLGMALFKAAVEIGKAPIPVEKLAVYLNRGQAPKYTGTADGMIVLNQKCVRNGRVNVDPARKTEAARVHEERRLVIGDVLVNSTGVGTLGRVGIWSRDLSATVDSHVTIVRINPNIVPPIIGAFAMLSVQSTIEAMGEGSTGQTELSPAKLGRVELDIPFGNHEALVKKLAALEAKSDDALHESQTLAALRDTLLPQLMSGKLRVRDVERIVEDAV